MNMHFKTYDVVIKEGNQTHNKMILYYNNSYNKPVKSRPMQIITELHLLNTGSTFLSGEDMCVQAAPEFLMLGSTCEKSKAHVHAFISPASIKH